MMACRSYRNTVVFSAGVIVVVMFFLLLPAVRAEDEVADMDFRVPPPENGALVDTFTLKLRGQDVKALTYKSPDDKLDVAAYYRSFFRDEKFDNVIDEMMPEPVPVGSIVNSENISLFKGKNFKEKIMQMLPKGKTRRMQFKKDQLVVEVALTPNEDGGTDVGIAKYVLPAGVARLEDLPLSTQDTFFKMPTQDQDGEDFSDIPRPPKSIRISSIDIESQTYVTYTTEIPLEEVVEFYLNAMPNAGWNLAGSANTGDLLKQYRKLTGDKKSFHLGKLNSPFSGSMSLDKGFAQTQALDFTNGNSVAKITIMPNIILAEKGVIVQIVYSE